MGFDPYNCSLKIWESTGIPIPKVGVPLGVWGFIPSHSPTLLGAWDVTPGLPSWPATLQAFAMFMSPRLWLRHFWSHILFFLWSFSKALFFMSFLLAISLKSSFMGSLFLMISFKKKKFVIFPFCNILQALSFIPFISTPFFLKTSFSLAPSFSHLHYLLWCLSSICTLTKEIAALLEANARNYECKHLTRPIRTFNTMKPNLLHHSQRFPHLSESTYFQT